jgi:hypothetical protein
MFVVLGGRDDLTEPASKALVFQAREAVGGTARCANIEICTGCETPA